ncbi:hypothetical protein [Croceibacterium aestuarii]|uniref:hypothetical protein n=1 Tax=Croceibacterium aestuarii TaxID=3064139 RepID=UPI00272E712C|nr:hypothetical protein [Croceibacterium sp. D39]
MKWIKAMGFVCLAVAGFFGFRLVLGLAMDQMVTDDEPQVEAVAAAPGHGVTATLAPAVNWSSSAVSGEEGAAPLPAASPAEPAFGEPDPEFGKPNPALAHPAVPLGYSAPPGEEPVAGEAVVN